MTNRLLFVYVLALAACRASAPQVSRYIPPEPRPVPTAERIAVLIAQLRDLRGEFTQPDYVYSLITDYRPIAEIASADKAAIPLLVDCLRDRRKAHITYSGERVAVGMICSHTLLETEYVKRHLQFSCFPPDWHGMVTPTLDQGVLDSAWADWRAWLKEHPLDKTPVSQSPNKRCN